MLSLKNLLSVVLTLLLVACGGGGGKAGTAPFGGVTTDPDVVSGGTLQVTLSSSVVSSSSPVLVTAKVTNSAGDPVAGKLVDFSTSNNRGLLNNSSTTSALTGPNGEAVVTLTPQSTISGATADEVIAEVSIGTEQLTDKASFSLTAINLTFDSFTTALSTISALGETPLTAVISGAASGSTVVVNLSSQCVQAGRASISQTAKTTTGTTTTITYLYTDDGCGQSSTTDRVQASIQGTSATTSLTLTLTKPEIGSIEFVSASPEKIFLDGSGYASTSDVTFVVKSTGDKVAPGATVSLELLTFSGGLLLDNVSTPVIKTADANGEVKVKVSAGSVPTPVRVKATVVGTTVSTVSSSLSVGVGLPTQLNFTLAGTVHNIEGYNLNGTKNAYTVIASDRTGNPVPEGTSVSFVTEGAGGQITSSGQVIADADGNNSAIAQFVSARASNAVKDGRVTVLAYALGEESCKDLNGNNVCDSGEPFQDLGNIYKDVIFDGNYTTTAPADEFVSTGINSSLACSAAPSGYPELANDVTVPTIANTCDGVQGRAYVRRATELVLSTSTANPFWNSNSVGGGTVITGCTARYFYDEPVKPSSLTARGIQINGSRIYGLPASTSLVFTLADANPEGRLNPMAAATNVTASTSTEGLTVSVGGGSPVASSLSATLAAVNVEFKTASSGNVTVSFESPVSKTKSSFSFFVSLAPIPSGSTACVY
jgi:hypothetical protein